MGLAMLLAAGCQSLPQRTQPAKAEPECPAKPANTLRGLVQYDQWLRERPPETLHPARSQAEERARTPGTPADRLRLALVLTVPGTTFRDETRARAVLQQVIRETQGKQPHVHAFATLLAANLDDRRWVREGFERKLADEQQRRKQLEQKLQELKAIEQQLQQRQQTEADATP